MKKAPIVLFVIALTLLIISRILSFTSIPTNYLVLLPSTALVISLIAAVWGGLVYFKK
ncbi:hypothetical protein [Companilactobacillus mishanensis]|uniref:hypothetical protein n=1 Tax=Companilactobacillus mishanensis TaxID=2486008 RepID=UPI001296B1B0|nr:hypothetical protein [Companilactobacillus mishanensis]